MSRWYCRITFPGSFRPSSSIKSRQCYLESYQSAESVNPNRIPGVSPAFSPFDPFDPSSYSLSSLILAIHVFSWTWDTWVVILLDGSRVWERLFHRALKFHGCRLRDRDEESIYHIYIYTRQFLVNSFWQGNVEWCTELEWSSFEMIRKDKYITQEIKLS